MTATRLPSKQQQALRMIARFGRTTDKRAANALVAKGLIRINREDPLPGEWGKPGPMAYYCELTQKTSE